MQAKQRFPPNDWKIVLLVDTQELVKSKKFNHQEFLQRLRQEIPCETRSLPTGDYLWVARRRTLSSSTNADEEEENEIVLDWIVERKTDKNLQYSLWLESKTYPPMKQMQIQSLKMKWSQIQNRVLLVEKGPKPWDVTVQQRNMVASYLKNLKQKDPSFTIRYTSGVEHTIQYLVKLHKDIEKNATIDSTTTTTLAQIRQRIRMGVNSLHFELYLSLRRIPRLGEEKIQFLRNLYPTREQMATAFHTNKLTKDKLSKLQLPNAKRPFGKKLAESIHQAVISTTSKAASSVAAFNPASPRNASFDDGSSTSSDMLPPSPFCRESIKNQQNQSCISSTTPSGMLVTPHRNSTPGVTRNVLQQPLQSFSLSSSDDDDYTIPPRLHFFQSHPRSSKKRGMPRNLDLFGPPSAKQRQQEISIIDLAQQQQTSNEDHSLAVVTPVRKDKTQNHQHQSSKRLPNRTLLFGPINDKKVHKNNAVIEILSD